MKKILVDGSLLVDSKNGNQPIQEGSVILDPEEFELYEKARETCIRIGELANTSKGGK